MEWRQIDVDGFGDPNLFAVVDMKVYKNRLYVGSRSTGRGAKLFRLDRNFSREVIQMPCGDDARIVGPIGTLVSQGEAWIYVAVHIDGEGTIIYRSSSGDSNTWSETRVPSGESVTCMCQFGQYLFAGAGGDGAGSEPQVWYVSANDDRWQISDGSWLIGRQNRENFAVSALCATRDRLYAGTWGNTRSSGGAEIWVLDRGHWQRDYQFDDPNIWGVISLCSFNGGVYAGTVNHGGAQIFRRRDSGGWEEVGPQFGSGPSVWPLPPVRYNAMCVFGGRLYAGGGFPTYLIRTTDGTHWEECAERGFGDRDNYTIGALAVFPQLPPYQVGVRYLMVGTIKEPQSHSGLELWASGEMYPDPREFPSMLYTILDRIRRIRG